MIRLTIQAKLNEGVRWRSVHKKEEGREFVGQDTWVVRNTNTKKYKKSNTHEGCYGIIGQDKKYTNVQQIQMLSCLKTPICGRIAETHQEATVSVSPINPSLT